MHIIIGILTALGGLLWAINSLQRSGFRLSSINPFYWHRRNQWRKKYSENPLYSLENPMEVAAALLLGVAKLEGEISREQKSRILSVFTEKFGLSSNQAQELFSSTAFMLQSENNFVKNIDKVVKPSREKFSKQQVESTLELAKEVASMDSPPTELQVNLINKIAQIFAIQESNNNTWH
jgi:uncharacterized tellurite resistance protein B-like protein